MNSATGQAELNNDHHESDRFSTFFQPLAQFLAGDALHKPALADALAQVDDGLFDRHFAVEASADQVCLTTSCHLLSMAWRHRLEGLEAQHFYKSDPLRYVRTNLFVQRVIGITRLTLGWPVYAFGAEAIGQTMMYPDDQAPGSDPGEPMLSLERPEDIPEYDPKSEVAGVIRETLKIMANLARIEPVAHLPAPYSLAAEIVGQENLILALTDRPEVVARFLDVLVDRVLAPWCDDIHTHLPEAWLELSDASGSPMFIGPRNFLAIAVEPVLKLRGHDTWGPRVFVANYRGDRQKARRSASSRSARQTSATTGFKELTNAKRDCCPWFLTRLEADQESLDDYVDYCKTHGMALYAGIGATRVDRNSIVDPVSHMAELALDLTKRQAAILDVRQSVSSGPTFDPSWPGDLYLEDTNAESDLELIRWIAKSGFKE